MPTTNKTGRNRKHKIGYISVGYSAQDNFWYSSEGVFATPKLAIDDCRFCYPVDFAYAIKVNLKIPKKKVK